MIKEELAKNQYRNISDRICKRVDLRDDFFSHCYLIAINNPKVADAFKSGKLEAFFFMFAKINTTTLLHQLALVECIGLNIQKFMKILQQMKMKKMKTNTIKFLIPIYKDLRMKTKKINMKLSRHTLGRARLTPSQMPQELIVELLKQ